MSFHPLVLRWFGERFAGPTAPQERGWKHIAAGEATLIAAPTGSGKTLAAFLWSINRLLERAIAGTLQDQTSVVYISPLKALGNDIEKNLREPLAAITALAASEGIALPEIRVALRSGDTPAGERRLMVRRPPHILITTPESLYILLTAERSRRFLRTAKTVIVDEIHAVAGDKRGAHLALSLERLDALAEQPLQRIGLSATQKPIEEIARLLVGAERVKPDGRPDCAIVDVGHRRPLDLSVEVPDQELGPIAAQAIWDEVYNRVIEQVKRHRTTLVFVNTRRLVERVSHQLTARLGEGKVGAHHGSLSRKTRLEIEERLKSGDLPVVVATASLELGIDIGHVELVCHIGAPRSLATLLQRVGRSGHWLGAIPKGIFYPLTRDDLMQCAAAIRAVRAGELDQVTLPRKPLDVLAQQMVAVVASLASGSKSDETGEGLPAPSISEDELFALVKKSYPYQGLTREEFNQVLEILSEGIGSHRGRRGAYIHRDRVHRRLRARRGARLAAITNGGAIPDTADYDVIQFPDETVVGKVNEDFAIESLAGDIFLLGNSSWRIRRVSQGKVWVEDAHGLPPTIPFWLGEAPARTRELSSAVSSLRAEIAARLADPAAAVSWLERECGVEPGAAEQMIAYVRETEALLGCVPTLGCVVAERFFDEAGGMQLVLHAPFGGRINRAWGLALRKRFCVTWDRELQAAATDDGIVLSLGEQHSFPLEDVFNLVRTTTLEKDLTQAALASPMFTNRWRWNATRALALLRFSGGKKVPMALQRMRAEDLLAAVFPEQLMCQDNRVGPIEVPDHPLVNETLRDCLYEAMDVDGLKEMLAAIEARRIQVAAVDTPTPSPMAHEILNANPYAFLDDAPLEERRARAVALRRTDPDLARGLGVLSAQAIEQVRAEAWPDIRDAEELHDLLLSVGILPVEEGPAWSGRAKSLIEQGRTTAASWVYGGRQRRAYVATERRSLVKSLLPEACFEPELTSLPQGDEALPAFAERPRFQSGDECEKGIRRSFSEGGCASAGSAEDGAGATDFVGEAPLSLEEAARKVIHGWMEISGPVTPSVLAEKLGIPVSHVERSLLALELSGVVLRGSFTALGKDSGEIEWCERGLLSRIHRLTLGQLRKEIEPVSASDLIKFLLRWQHVQPGTQLCGRAGVAEIVGQLQGMELPAPAWEQHVLPGRMAEYDPKDLEDLCLAGVVAWGRLRSNGAEESQGAGEKKRRLRRSPGRAAPIAFVLREELDHFLTAPVDRFQVSSAARDVLDYLERHGASFLGDVARGTGLLKIKTEEALWELVAAGLVTGDGIAGLRVLIMPEVERQQRRRRLRVVSGGRSPERLMPVGRWSLWRSAAEAKDEAAAEPSDFIARQFLKRYGVIFRELLARESCAPPWRGLLAIYRKLEARGEIRGGRFVNSFVGEQFALPEAVDILRAVRRSQEKADPVIISAADPLNLVGILTPGARVSPYSGECIAYIDGQPVEIGPLGALLSRLQISSETAQQS